MKRRLLSLFTLLLSLTLLCSCWQDIPEEIPEDLIVDNIPSLPDPPLPEGNPLPAEFVLPYAPEVTLDPLTCPDGPHQTIGALLYEGLFALDASFQPQPTLCASYECDETRSQWTFHIADNVLFSDGSALTAADVTASLLRAKDCDRYRSRLAKVERITRVENTVQITLTGPNASLPALLDIPIVKAGTENAPAPIGTGPYRFSRNEIGFVLLPSEVHQGSANLPADRIRLLECAGTTALHHQFSSRRIHLMVTDLTVQDAYRPVGDVQITDADTTLMQFIGFNTNRPLFSSPELRNALGLGIDREALTARCLSGHAVAAQSPVSPASPLYPHTLDRIYSPDTFREAMAAVGCSTGVSKEAVLLVNAENRFKVSAAEYVAKSLSAYDIKITVKALPWAEYTAALAAGDFDLYYGEVKLTADWDLSQLVGRGGSINFGGYDNVITDIRLSEYASADDPKTALRSLCRYLQAQSPILPLCFKRTSVLTPTDVVDGLAPTASNPFFQLESVSINLSQ